MKILHIHQDYPDGMPYPNTKAVSNLIDACKKESGKVEHFVLSINRTSNPFKVKIRSFEEGYAIVYWCIPVNFLYAFGLAISARILLRRIKAFKFDIVHGHKLTTEGFLASLLARCLSIPYVISVRGGSDVHNIRRLPAHKKLFSRIYRNASHVFWVSPWAKKYVENCIDEEIKEIDLFPNICLLNFSELGKKIVDNSVYVTAVAFHQYERKGLVQLINAFSLLVNKGYKLSLDIYGSGPDKNISIVSEEIARLKLEGIVRLKGKVAQNDLLQQLRSSKGFILPSMNETFGMAYIEALSVDCPIIYMAETGIDGFFEDYTIGVKLRDQKIESILDAIIELDTNNNFYRSQLVKLKVDKYLNGFVAESVGKKYLHTMKSIVDFR